MISGADRSTPNRGVRKGTYPLVPGFVVRGQTARAAISFIWFACTLACGTHPVGDQTAVPVEVLGDVINSDEIQSMGARSAWDVISRRARHLNLGETAQWRVEQEARSESAPKTPCPVTGGCPVAPAEVFVDGVPVNDIQSLRSIPASDVVRIHIMNGRDAATFFGRAAPGGAIVITTIRRMNPGKGLDSNMLSG